MAFFIARINRSRLYRPVRLRFHFRPSRVTIQINGSLRVLSRMEMLRNVPIVIAPPLSLDLAGAGIEPLAKRFVQSFGSVGNLGFVFASLVMAAGVAASPVLLPRSGTTR